MPAPSYELEHIPVIGSAVRQSLAAWGCSHRLRRESWGIDSLQLTDTTDGAPWIAPVFAYRAEIVLWRDGSRLWRGWVTQAAAQATPQSDARPYTILGAGWWLSISPWALGWTGTRTSRTVGNWVSLALQRAIYVGAPIALSETPEIDYALSMRAPDLLDSDTCWTLIQRAARYAPNSAGYWDDSGPVSIFRTRERADLAPITLEVGSQVTSVDELAALHESQLDAVRLIYGHWYDGLGGETWETYTRDRAGDNDAPGPANILEARVAVESYDVALESVGYGIAAKLYAALGPLSWAGRLTCDESATAAPLIRPGQVINLTAGNSEWATMNAVVAAVELSATAEADVCTIELGPPPPLGPQDYMELFRIAGQAGNSVSGNPTPFPSPTPPSNDQDLPGGDFSDIQDTLFDTHPTFALEWSHLAATATHCGKAPLNGEETTPPTRWRTVTFGGTMTVHHANSYDSCEVPRTATRTYQYSGTNYYTGCEPTIVAIVQIKACGNTSSHATHSLGDGDWEGAPSGSYTHTITQTTYTVVGTGACYQGNVCSYLGDGPCDGTGTASMTLGSPDTDGAAWARAIEGLSWSEWGAAVAAAYEDRTTLSFYRCRLKGRGAGTSAVPGWTYIVEIPTEQRPYGSGADWTAAGTISLSVTADGSGTLTLPEFEVDCPVGYERVPTGDFTLAVGL